MDYYLKAGTVHTAIESEQTDLYIGVKDGKISTISKDEPTGDVRVIDYSDAHVSPGFVDAHSHLGLYYESYHGEPKDGNESSKPLTPELRVIDAFWPFDTAIDDVVAGGVTTVCILPGSANLIGGVGAVLKLKRSDLVDQMALKKEVAMKMAVGINPKGVHGQQNKRSPMTRMASASLIRQAFYEAIDYRKKRKGDKPPAKDLGKENLLKILSKELPVFAHCARVDDITTLLRLQDEFEFTLILHHAYEAHTSHELIGELKKRSIQVVLGPSFRTKGSSESQLFSFASQLILLDAGLEDVAQMSDHPVIPAQYLNIQAALCVKEGLDNLRGLQSITINAARILGVDDQVGSIETGKDADLVIWSGHPLDGRSQVLATVVDGSFVHINDY